mgnify:CR=1 FL=1
MPETAFSSARGFVRSTLETPSRFFARFFPVLVLLAITLSLTALFLVYSASLWLSQDPDRAFSRSASLITGVARVWDFGVELVNVGVSGATTVIPAWNSASHYIFQPLVYSTLSIFAIAFTDKPYNGLVSEDDVEFQGHLCPGEHDPVSPASRWCGLLSAYTDSEQFLQSGSVFNASTIHLSAATARRLSLGIGEPVLPTVLVDSLLDAFESIATSLIVVAAPLADILINVYFEIGSAILGTIVWALREFGKAVAAFFEVLFESGMFMTLLKLGLDLLLSVVMRLLLPYLFSLLDGLMCLIHMFNPSAWSEELQCIDNSCFTEESDGFVDSFQLFSSVPAVVDQVGLVMHDLVSSVTGQRHNEGDSKAADLPFSLGFEQTPALEECNACFVCRQAEMRAIWFLIAVVFGCVDDGIKIQSRVEAHCMQRGSFYTELCGSTAGSFLTDQQWASARPLHRSIEFKQASDFAASLESIAEQRGVADPEGGLANQIAESFYNRGNTGLAPDDALAPLARQTCRVARQYQDDFPGPAFADMYARGSVPHATFKFLYASCKYTRGMPTCVPETGKWALNVAVEVEACLEDSGACRRDRDLCRGRCSGLESEAELSADAVTHILKKQLLHLPNYREAAINGTRVNLTVPINLFYDGESEIFEKYAARLRVRGGMTGALHAASASVAPCC